MERLRHFRMLWMHVSECGNRIFDLRIAHALLSGMGDPYGSKIGKFHHRITFADGKFYDISTTMKDLAIARQHAEDMVKGHFPTHREFQVAKAFLALLEAVSGAHGSAEDAFCVSKVGQFDPLHSEFDCHYDGDFNKCDKSRCGIEQRCSRRHWPEPK